MFRYSLTPNYKRQFLSSGFSFAGVLWHLIVAALVLAQPARRPATESDASP